MKRLNRRNPFRKAVTVQDFIDYMDAIASISSVTGDRSTCHKYGDFADHAGIPIAELHTFLDSLEFNHCSCSYKELLKRVTPESVIYEFSKETHEEAK